MANKLMHFKNIKDFIEYASLLYSCDKWTIKSTSNDERAKIMEHRSYFKKLKELYNSNFEKETSDNQIISFLDTMHFMFLILKQVKEEQIIEETNIILEYEIPIPSKPRIDYLLVYRNTIIIIEFSKTNSTKELGKITNQKQQQLYGYINEMKNIVNNNIQIFSKAFIYLPEDELCDYEYNITTNDKTISCMCDFITNKFKQDENAINQII